MPLPRFTLSTSPARSTGNHDYEPLRYYDIDKDTKLSEWKEWTIASNALLDSQRPNFFDSRGKCIFTNRRNKYTQLLRQTMVTSLILGDNLFVHSDIRYEIGTFLGWNIDNLNIFVEECLDNPGIHRFCMNEPFFMRLTEDDESPFWTR